MYNMKISYNIKQMPVLFFFVTILLLDYHCFYLFKYAQIMAQFLSGNYYHILLSAIALLLVILIMRTRNAKKYSGLKYLMKYNSVIYFGWLCIIIYSAIIYDNQSLLETVAEGAYILIIPLSIVILSFFHKEKGMNIFFDIVNCFNVIWCMAIIFQQVMYQRTGTLIFDFETYIGENIRIRTYGLRLGLGVFGNMMLIYNFSYFLNKKKNRKLKRTLVSGMLVVLGLYCIIFVQQTRAYIVSDIIAMAAIYLLSLGNKLSLKKIFLVIVFLISFIVFINTDSFRNLLFSFSKSTSNESYASTAIRLDAYAYYIQCFTKNPLFGNGFARAEYYNYVEHGYRFGWYYYYSDTGFIGLLANMGIFGAYIFLAPLCRMLKTSKRLLKKERIAEENFLIGICIWMILNSISLIVVGKHGIIAFAFIIAFSEYIREKINVTKV